MSAFTVNGTHIAAIVGTYSAMELGFTQLQAAARILADANAHSMAARYASHADGPVAVDARDIAHFAANPVSPEQLLKAVHCMAYQSCEYRGWATSDAHTMCTLVETAARRALEISTDPKVRVETTACASTYDAAHWEIPPMTHADPTPAPERKSTGSALADLILSVEDHGDEQAAIAGLAASHRGLMRKALVALGLHTRTSVRRVKRPEAERVLGAAIVRAALAHEGVEILSAAA